MFFMILCVLHIRNLGVIIVSWASTWAGLSSMFKFWESIQIKWVTQQWQHPNNMWYWQSFYKLWIWSLSMLYTPDLSYIWWHVGIEKKFDIMDLWINKRGISSSLLVAYTKIVLRMDNFLLLSLHHSLSICFCLIFYTWRSSAKRFQDLRRQRKSVYISCILRCCSATLRFSIKSSRLYFAKYYI